MNKEQIKTAIGEVIATLYWHKKGVFIKPQGQIDGLNARLKELLNMDGEDSFNDFGGVIADSWTHVDCGEFVSQRCGKGFDIIKYTAYQALLSDKTTKTIVTYTEGDIHTVKHSNHANYKKDLASNIKWFQENV